jgi:hypothetical protein
MESKTQKQIGVYSFVQEETKVVHQSGQGFGAHDATFEQISKCPFLTS